MQEKGKEIQESKMYRYQQQQHPIDNILGQHIHGVLPQTSNSSKPKPSKPSKPKITITEKQKQFDLKRFGYYYKDNGEVVYSEEQKVKNKATKDRQFRQMLNRDPRGVRKY